jgi:chitinase
MTTPIYKLSEMLSGSIQAGSSFWGGLSATFSINNQTNESVSNWKFSFISRYSNFDFYNATESAVANGDGTYTVTVSAATGAAPLAPGGRLDLGFTVNSDREAAVNLANVMLAVGESGAGPATSSTTSAATPAPAPATTAEPSSTPTDPAASSPAQRDDPTARSNARLPTTGLSVEIQLGGSWSGTYEGTLTVRNASGGVVPAGWRVELISDHALRNISDFSMQQVQRSDGRYTVTLSAPGWSAGQDLAAGASLSTYFQASGSPAGQGVSDLFEVLSTSGGSMPNPVDTGSQSPASVPAETILPSTPPAPALSEPITPAPAGADAATVIKDGAMRVVGYFEEWGIYGRDFRVADVNADALTHLNYSFFGITPTAEDRPFMAAELNVLPGAMVQSGYLGLNSNSPGGLGIHDSWAAYEKTFSQPEQLVSRRFDAEQWQALSVERRQSYLSGGDFDVTENGDGTRLVRARPDTWASAQGGIQRTFNQADWDGLSDARQAYLVEHSQQYSWSDQWQGSFTPGGSNTAQKIASVDAHFASGSGRSLTLRADGDLVRDATAWLDDSPAEWEKQYAGNLNQLRLLKELHPELTIGFAIGGWTLSGNFSTNLDDAGGRELFTQSIIDHLEYYDFFGSVDFDWEYPGGGGLSSNGVSDNDGSNLALTLQVLDQKLEALEERTGRSIEVSIAAPGGAEKLANLNLQAIDPYVDFYNVMTYDFHGGWENRTGHQAAMTGDSGGYDVVTAIDQFRQAGIAMDKVVLGAPAYTRAWGGVQPGGSAGYEQSGTAALAPGSFEKGTYDQKDLITGIEAGNYQLIWDDNNKAAFAYDASNRIWSSVETTATIAGKAAYAQEAGLGGMMFWAISNDSEGNQSLISAAHDALIGGSTLGDIAGRAPGFDQVIGGDGMFSISDFTNLS